RHDLERIRRVLGRSTPAIGGGTSAKQGQALERSWNAGTLPVLLGHPASMGHGLNLQASGDTLVWFGLPWDYDQYDQTIRRLRRQGSVNRRIFNHRILARGTLEHHIMPKALEKKGKVQDALLDALKRRRK